MIRPEGRDALQDLEILIREMREDEVGAVASLVIGTFAEQIAQDFTAAGIRFFTDFAASDQLAERHAGGAPTFVAEVGGRLAGMLQLRLPAHIWLLFVSPRYQRRGVARRLMDAAIQRVRAERPAVVALTVNSSTYAVAVYRALGFEVSGKKSKRNGIVAVPMRLELG